MVFFKPLHNGEFVNKEHLSYKTKQKSPDQCNGQMH